MPVTGGVISAVVKTFTTRDQIRLHQVLIHQLIAITEVHLNHIDSMPARAGFGQCAVKNSLTRRKVVLQSQSSIASIKSFRQSKELVNGQRAVIGKLPFHLSTLCQIVELFFLLERFYLFRNFGNRGSAGRSRDQGCKGKIENKNRKYDNNLVHSSIPFLTVL